jgi:hypothetical protein
LSIVSFIKVQDSAISFSLFAGDAYLIFIFQVCKLPVSFTRPKLPEPYSNPTAATAMLNIHSTQAREPQESAIQTPKNKR